jgi:uncharacterized protein
MTFIGRTHELEILKREYTRPHPSLIVLYGRRRVGKSTLILESLRDSRFVYHQASRLTDTDNLALFKRSLETTLGPSPPTSKPSRRINPAPNQPQPNPLESNQLQPNQP